LVVCLVFVYAQNLINIFWQKKKKKNPYWILVFFKSGHKSKVLVNQLHKLKPQNWNKHL